MADPPKSPDDDDGDDNGVEHPSPRRFGHNEDHEQDLVEDLPPGPDTPVIKKETRLDIERSWFLGVFLTIFILTILADLLGSALLSPTAWAQMKPEVSDTRAFLIQVTGVIIGFYFGTSVRRGKKA